MFILEIYDLTCPCACIEMWRKSILFTSFNNQFRKYKSQFSQFFCPVWTTMGSGSHVESCFEFWLEKRKLCNKSFACSGKELSYIMHTPKLLLCHKYLDYLIDIDFHLIVFAILTFWLQAWHFLHYFSSYVIRISSSFDFSLIDKI